jgi:hypothetical protein
MRTTCPAHLVFFRFILTTFCEEHIGGCIQKFPDWPPGARTANGTTLCHYVQLYRYFVSQYSEFFCHNPLCCFSTSNTTGKSIFRYRLSVGTFGYTFVFLCYSNDVSCYLGSNILLNTLLANTFNLCSSLVSDTQFHIHIKYEKKVVVFTF